MLAFTLRSSPYLHITLPYYCRSWAYLNTWIKEWNHANVDYCYQIYFCSTPKTFFFHVAPAFFSLYFRPVVLDHWTNCISITWELVRNENLQFSHVSNKLKNLVVGNKNLCFKKFDNHSSAYSIALSFHRNLLLQHPPLTSRNTFFFPKL